MRWTPEAIKQRRDDLDLTQQQLADRLGVVLRTVTAWESGESRPRKSGPLDDVLGDPPTPLAAKGAAELVAEINERLTELARRIPERSRRVSEGDAMANHDATDYADEIDPASRHQA